MMQPVVSLPSGPTGDWRVCAATAQPGLRMTRFKPEQSYKQSETNWRMGIDHVSFLALCRIGSCHKADWEEERDVCPFFTPRAKRFVICA